MKAKHLLLDFVIVLSLTGLCAQEYPVEARCDPAIARETYSRAGELEEVLEAFTRNGAPGVALAVHSPEGWWYSAKGYSRIEDNTGMQVCHLQYLQSISKTYHAVAVMKLYEEGIVELEKPITEYLPGLNEYVSDAEHITVEMLLNHTSGIPEYNFSPNYVAKLLQSPEYAFTGKDYLGFIKGKPLTAEPGARYSYRNTNYVILALLLDKLTGDHGRFLEDSIFQPLGLDDTYYKGGEPALNNNRLVNSYWDRNGTGIVENASYLQRKNVQYMIGDDGIITTPLDAVKFLKGLVEGKLLSENALDLMRTWAQYEDGHPAYGLGLDYVEINGVEGYGHSGGGIGAGCELYYFPEKDLYYFLVINLGVVTESPFHKGIEEIRTGFYSVLLD
jgi:D-alanyl-D-alanine carboxypeptidase